MIKSAFVSLLLLVISIHAPAQSLALFDTRLYAEKLTLCDLLSRYVSRQQEFKFGTYDSSFYFISAYDNSSTIFGNWSYTVRNDSLSQLSFASLELPVTEEWHEKLSALADSAIRVFTLQYGKPVKDTLVKNSSPQKGKKQLYGPIYKAMWVIDGQKLKVDFSVIGEHGQYTYLLSIQRFKDYYGNTKLPPWWDGY